MSFERSIILGLIALVFSIFIIQVYSYYSKLNTCTMYSIITHECIK